MTLFFSKVIKKLEMAERDDAGIIHLTANEPVISPLAQKWQASILNARYTLGSLKERDKKEAYLFKKNFVARGIPVFDELEILAKEACKKMFHCQDVEFRVLSGLHGIISVVGSLTAPGDLVATLPPQFVGHFATADLLKRMGRRNIILPYNHLKLELDLIGIKKLARKNKIKMVYLDTMHYFKPYPLREIRKILPDSILVYDGSHVLGLIAGGKFQNPLKEGADILNGNTHKTIPGPPKGMILYKDKKIAEISKKIIGDAFISSGHTGPTIALFITLLEMKEFGREYASQIIKNSQALAEFLAIERFSILAFPEIKPQTHQVLLIADNKNDGLKLIKAGISVNSFSLFGKNIIRFGTQQITRLGMKEKEIALIVQLIKRVLRENQIRQVQKEIRDLRKSFQKVYYCFND
jgi:glycine/serine hydroxymethyltransferase